MAFTRFLSSDLIKYILKYMLYIKNNNISLCTLKP